MEYTFDDATVSDLHKDAYGFRPGATFMQAWKGMSPDAKQGMWDFLCSELESEMEREKLFETRSYEFWVHMMTKTAKEKGISFQEAIRQDVEEYQVNGDYGYYCFQNGLAYDRELEIKRIVEGEASD